MLFNKKGHLVGLDIGSAVIKVAEVKSSGKDIELKKFEMTPIPSGLIEEGQILDMDELSRIIRNIFKTHRIKSNNVAISTGGSSVVIKNINVPAVSENALLESIRFEAEQYIPYDIDEMNVDFQIIGDGEFSADQMNVLLVAVKKDLVAEYIELTDRSGLNVSVIDVDSFAFQNVFERFSRKDGELNMLIDIGVHKTSLNIVKDSESIMMRDSSSGINQLREQISSELNCSFDEADNIISGVDTTSMPLENFKEFSDGFSKMWSIEIQNVIKTFQTKSTHGDVKKIFLCGGGSLLGGFVDTLASTTSIPISIFNPFDVFKLKSKDFSEEFIQMAAPFASIALGLALRKVDDK
ncbi:MAG: type IV pilus assembly protein PilM [Desulfamplus sp.]|nr:type IV pilus assembly protein PilM [Desulfamplus sp.]